MGDDEDFGLKMCISNRQMFAIRLKRLTKTEGVIDLVVVNSKGMVWYTTMDNALTALNYCRVWRPFCDRVTSVCRNLDPTDEVTSLSISTKKHELLIIPDAKFLLLAFQQYGPGETLYPDFKKDGTEADIKA